MAEPKAKKETHGSSTGGRSRWLYIGSVIILVLVVVTFVGAPVVGGLGGPGNLVFGRYGGQDIAYAPGNFFARQYEAIAATLRNSDNQMELEWQLRLAWRQAFNSTVLRTAILHEANRSGVRVTEERVDELIAQDPRFNRNGRFDAAAYRAMGNQDRFQLRSFHRENEIFERFINDVIDGAPIASGEREFVAAMSGPERSFEVVRFPFARFPQEQVVRFAREEGDLFTELNLAVVTVASRDEADRVRNQAMEPGNPFGELARTFSRDLYADQSGEMGAVWGYELQQELLNPEDLALLTALEEGTISPPVETTSGWSFYRAMESPVAFSPESTRAVEAARTYMQIFEQGRIQDFVRREAEQFVAAFNPAEDSLSARAAEAGVTVVRTERFPVNYGNLPVFGRVQAPDAADLADAAFRESFFVTAFSLEPGELSEPIALRQSVVVMRLLEDHETSEDDGFIVREFYRSLHRQFQSDVVETAFVIDELLQDNFAQAFNRYVLGTN